MGRSGIEQLLFAMDYAFEGLPGLDRGHALLVNLASVREEDWSWLPPGGSRTIGDIVRHVGLAKHVYDNHAFGDRSMVPGRPETMPALPGDAPRSELLDWVRAGHASLRSHLAALSDDSELLRPRNGWSLRLVHETRFVINTMISHDAYHAGEINHIRALAQGDDR
ncbi:MAG TPA: DinB family protein [Dehalococcoidia bacterium]|nr:DinB family protein [Dehalococcoidia bacterium]